MNTKLRVNSEVLGELLFSLFIALVMLFVSIITIYPFIYILFYSLSNPMKVTQGLILYPHGFTLDSYKMLFESSSGIAHAMFISVARSVIGSFLAILVTSMGAYTMSRRDLFGRSIIIKFVTITMYFSSGMIPTYILMQRLRLTGTFWVYIIPYLFNVFNMILIKTYIEGLPAALQESAVIDGANDYTLFFRIVLPSCKPVLAAVLLFECVNHWNLYTDTMLYNASRKDLHTLQYVLMTFIETRTRNIETARLQVGISAVNSTSLKMALTVITIIPILFVYPNLQKYFAKGILIGAVKG